jgi:hypothetical protein
MAILDITEYDRLSIDNQGRVILVGLEPQRTNQQVAIGGGSAQSAALGDTTRFVRLHADAVCRVAFGPNPTAATTSMRLAAGASEYFGVYPGHKVAVITTT